MLFGVPLSLLGHDDGKSPSGGKISFAYRQIKHFFNYMLLNRPQLKYFLGFREHWSQPSLLLWKYTQDIISWVDVAGGIVQNIVGQNLKNHTVSL